MLTTAYQWKGLDVKNMNMSMKTQPEEGTRHSMASVQISNIRM